MTVNSQKIAAVWPGTDTYDTLIGVTTISFTFINNSLATNTAGYFIYYDDNFTDLQYQGLPLGIYSLNDGVWYDMNGQDGPLSIALNHDTGAVLHTSFTVPSGGVPGYAAGATVSGTMKVGILSISGTETLTRRIGGGTLSYNSGVNYQKISIAGEIPIVASTSGSTLGVTIPHNLGYVPTFRVWKRSSTNSSIAPAAQFGVVGGGLRVDSTNLYMDGLIGETGNWIYRVYKD